MLSSLRILSAGVLFVAISAAAFAAVEIWPRQPAGTSEAPRQTASPVQVSRYSGLPLPRFVSVKTSKVNVRRGPSRQHPIAWSFTQKGLPVEITRETENWRLVRDSEGDEGWIYHGLLSGARTALVAPWDREGLRSLANRRGEKGGVVARLEPGVLAQVESCDGKWCRIAAGGYGGWIGQDDLWGVYPGEVIN